VKEFLVYTALRIALFAGALGIVVGVWGLFTDSVPVLWAVVLAFVISGVASFFLLNATRERFARKVQARAERASARFEERKAREDLDDPVEGTVEGTVDDGRGPSS
jgi:uncharacterized membrane protein